MTRFITASLTIALVTVLSVFVQNQPSDARDDSSGDIGNNATEVDAMVREFLVPGFREKERILAVHSILDQITENLDFDRQKVFAANERIFREFGGHFLLRGTSLFTTWLMPFPSPEQERVVVTGMNTWKLDPDWVERPVSHDWTFG